MENEPQKIFLAEDDKLIVKEFEDYFNTLDDFQITGIADGAREALEMIKRERPSVVIVDIILQQGIGTLLAKKLLSGEHLDYKPCVLVITQVKSINELMRIEALGVSKIFKKYDNNFTIKQVGDWLQANYEELPEPRKEVA